MNIDYGPGVVPQSQLPPRPFEYEVAADRMTAEIEIGGHKVTFGSVQEIEYFCACLGGVRREMLPAVVGVNDPNPRPFLPIDEVHFHCPAGPGYAPKFVGGSIAMRSEAFGWFAMPSTAELFQRMALWLDGKTTPAPAAPDMPKH
jgi:hypothetical protein